MTKYIKQADIGKGGSCHLFRHTVTTLMLDNGAVIRFIQQMQGKSPTSKTGDVDELLDTLDEEATEEG